MADAAASPPIANRGVYPHSSGVCPVPQFDWYGATVCAHPTTVLDHIEQALMDAGEDTRRVDGGAVKHYGAITFIHDAKGHKLAAVKHGGHQPHPHAEGEGAASPVVAEAIRAMREEHFPTRIDSALDMTAPGLFERLHEFAQAAEGKHRVQLNYAGAAIDNDERGTTIYVGSRQSQVFLRIYQKGLQLAEQQALRPDQITPDLLNWVRSEIVFKPKKKPVRQFAASVTPQGVWGVSSWTQEFARDALSIEAERVNVNQRRESNHERALRFMAHQYRGHLHQLLTDCEGDQAQAFGVLLDLAGLTERQEAA